MGEARGEGLLLLQALEREESEAQGEGVPLRVLLEEAVGQAERLATAGVGDVVALASGTVAVALPQALSDASPVAAGEPGAVWVVELQ